MGRKVLWHLKEGQSPCDWCCDDSSWNGTPGFFRDIDVDFYSGPRLGICPGCAGVGIAGLSKREQEEISNLRFNRLVLKDQLDKTRDYIKFGLGIYSKEKKLLPQERQILSGVIHDLKKEDKTLEKTLAQEYTFKEVELMLIVGNKWIEAGSHPKVYAASVVRRLKEYING